MTQVVEPLVELAELHGIQRAYQDAWDNTQHAGSDALLAALRALDVAITDPDEAVEVLAASRRERWSRLTPPVVAAFDGAVVAVELRLPYAELGRRVDLHLVLEEGDAHDWSEDISGRAPQRVERLGDETYGSHVLHVRDLPYGYHRLTTQVGGATAETLLIVAPPRAFDGGDRPRRQWGVFLPLHALRTGRDWGVGDLTDLRSLARVVAAHGASVVGTLPLLPVYLGAVGERLDPSPYSPVSRLFWNELHLDLAAAPEATRHPGLLTATTPRGARYVDYRDVAAVKGRVLRALSETFFAEPGDRRGDLEWFITQRPEVEQYALFRGAVARYGSRWWEWPTDALQRRLTLDTVDLGVARMHLYAQLLAREQVSRLAGELRRGGQHPYLDLPVGAITDGFDVWRYRELFVLDADTGAPPDSLFTAGQNWRLPPLHPQRLRASGYRHLIDVLRHHMELADVLRIDHVMGLHRLFWIPHGIEPSRGVYVRYPAEELYAILSLESHRHSTRMVGEDLGTVPQEVEDALQRHGIARMYVVQYELELDADDPLPPAPSDVLASVNTHDMPPFARWWDAVDAQDGLHLGLADEGTAQQQRDLRGRIRRTLASLLAERGHLDPDRLQDPEAVLVALLEWLAAGDAAIVLVNLEDLWQEVEPQNVPGTGDERPNWRRRARFTLEELEQLPAVRDVLRRVGAARGAQQGRAIAG
ncbi:MAG TPA: 4-alpha-glucanotransferase [Nitriliruptorales bacterium]|nr:4-alpha-glucanotransferase [Nitriliruptorales bacterium]